MGEGTKERCPYLSIGVHAGEALLAGAAVTAATEAAGFSLAGVLGPATLGGHLLQVALIPKAEVSAGEETTAKGGKVNEASEFSYQLAKFPGLLSAMIAV